MRARPPTATSDASRKPMAASRGRSWTWLQGCSPPSTSRTSLFALMKPDRTTMPDARSFEDRRFYGRRKGRPLRKGQQHLIDTLLPQLAIAPPSAGRIDPRSLFAHRPEQVWLEIGFGGGEHLADQARANPDVGLI